MSQHFCIQLPTKQFLAKYLQFLYGTPIVYNSDDYFGMVVAACIEKNVYTDRSEEEIRYKHFEVLNYQLTIHLPTHWLTNYYHGTGIKTEKAIFITKLFEERFEEDLHRYVDAGVRRGQQRKTSIEDFAREYGLEIDVDITYDNLKQTEYRFRKKSAKRRNKSPLELSLQKAS